MIIAYFAPFITTFMIAYGLLSYLSKAQGLLAILDHPNHRSLHTKATPRTGGIGLFISIVIGCTMLHILSDSHMIMAYSGAVILAVVGFLDDKFSLPVLPRLFAQSVVVGLLIVCFEETLIQLLMDWPVLAAGWYWLLFFLVIVWFINLYNFMDGMDGLAATQAITALIGFALFAWFANDRFYLCLTGVVLSALFAFLRFNISPAKLFMGDTGSLFMAYILVLLSALGIERGVFSLMVPLVVFSPFWLDASVTLLKRLYNREKVWQAHKKHLYQRLVSAGYSTNQVLLAELAVMLVCLLVATLYQFEYYAGIMLLPFFYVIIYWLAGRLIAQRLSSVQ